MKNIIQSVKCFLGFHIPMSTATYNLDSCKATFRCEICKRHYKKDSFSTFKLIISNDKFINVVFGPIIMINKHFYDNVGKLLE